uniref:Ephrin RBD domain-containing protein n=1 Tax=Panagrolaimus sp. JU765 TaxID=591449 RepID=A0AC34QVV7_9BILA
MNRLFIQILLIFLIFLQSSNSLDIIVDWSPESVLFNKGHLVTKKFVKMRDQVVFDCPEDKPISILMVTKDEAMKCDVKSSFNQSLVGLCTPERKRINFVVRDFSLLPNVPIFKEGEEYYFISTSNGTENGMRNTEGGFCRTHDMKLAMKVSGRATSKNDTSRNPDILMLFSPYPIQTTIDEDEKEKERNRVVTKPKSLEEVTTISNIPRYEAAYPAYVVFPDRLSIVVQSEKELKNVIEAYIQTHQSHTRDYSIYPIKDFNPKVFKGGDTIVWEDPRFPSKNAEYEIQGTAAPLSSDHVPHFSERTGDERRGINNRRKFGRKDDSPSSFESMFDYEIGYEDGFSDAFTSRQFCSIWLIFTSIVVFINR